MVLYPQNGDRIVTIVSVTSLHPMYNCSNKGKLSVGDKLFALFEILQTIADSVQTAWRCETRQFRRVDGVHWA